MARSSTKPSSSLWRRSRPSRENGLLSSLPVVGGEIQTHAAPKKLLMNRGFSIVGDFSCKGWTTWGPLKLFGGTNKGRPNEEDLEEARVFARGLKEKYI